MRHRFYQVFFQDPFVYQGRSDFRFYKSRCAVHAFMKMFVIASTAKHVLAVKIASVSDTGIKPPLTHFITAALSLSSFLVFIKGHVFVLLSSE